MDVRVLSRKGIEKDARTRSIEDDDINRLQRDLDEEVKILKEERNARLRKMLVGNKVSDDVKDSRTREVICHAGKRLTEAHLERVKDDHLTRIKLDDAALMLYVEELVGRIGRSIKSLEVRYGERIERVKKGDELRRE